MGAAFRRSEAQNELGVKVEIRTKGIDYLRLVQTPPHGYGKNMNPCIDCRIFMLKKTVEVMKEIDASFVITGEVIGQRPMSQRRAAINLIERESGLAGLILRPLSARLFPPTIPEKEGTVDREKLLDLSGRSRKGQYRLAREYDLKEFGCPAGGCLLTDPIFAGKLRDLFRHNPECTMADAAMLKIGRHFRLAEKTRLIVGRNKEENERLAGLSRADGLLLKPLSFVGPSGLLIGETDEGRYQYLSEYYCIPCQELQLPPDSGAEQRNLRPPGSRAHSDRSRTTADLIERRPGRHKRRRALHPPVSFYKKTSHTARPCLML